MPTGDEHREFCTLQASLALVDTDTRAQYERPVCATAHLESSIEGMQYALYMHHFHIGLFSH